MERSASAPPEDRGLRREAIGLREVFFQSVTHMAPAARGRLLDHRRRELRLGGPPALGAVRAGRVPAGRDLDRSTRQAPAVGRRLLHVHGPRDPPVDRVPGGLGVRVRRAARRARALPDLRAGGRRDAADRVRLVVLDLVVDLRDRRRGPRCSCSAGTGSRSARASARSSACSRSACSPPSRSG